MTTHSHYVVTELDELRRLAGRGFTLGDAEVLCRLLHDAGQLSIDDAGRVVIDVSGPDELRAWIHRAQVAARRERSGLRGAGRPPVELVQ